MLKQVSELNPLSTVTAAMEDGTHFILDVCTEASVNGGSAGRAEQSLRAPFAFAFIAVDEPSAPRGTHVILAMESGPASKAGHECLTEKANLEVRSDGAFMELVGMGHTHT